MSHARAKDSEMQSKKRAAEEEIPRELRDLKKTYLKPPEILLNDPNVKVISYASNQEESLIQKKYKMKIQFFIITTTTITLFLIKILYPLLIP